MKMFDVLYENKMYQDIWNEEGGVDRIGQETQNLFRTFFSKMYQQESRCE